MSKRLILLLILFVLFTFVLLGQRAVFIGQNKSSGSPSGGFTFINSSSCVGSSDGNVVAITIPAVGADGEIVSIANYSATTFTAPTDNQGNTLSCGNTYRSSGNPNSTICYHKITSSATTIITYSVSGSFPAICGMTVAGLNTSPLDGQQTQTTNFSVPLKSDAAITPTGANELHVTAIVSPDSGTPSVNSSFTMVSSVGQGGNNFGLAFGYWIDTGITSAWPQWTFTTGCCGGISDMVLKHN